MTKQTKQPHQGDGLWHVYLEGREEDIKRLAQQTADAECKIKQEEDGTYYLCGARLERQTDAHGVRTEAWHVVEGLNKFAHMANIHHQNVAVPGQAMKS